MKKVTPRSTKAECSSSSLARTRRNTTFHCRSSSAALLPGDSPDRILAFPLSSFGGEGDRTERSGHASSERLNRGESPMIAYFTVNPDAGGGGAVEIVTGFGN